MQIIVKRVSPFMEVLVKDGGTTIETGLLNENERQYLSMELRNAADSLWALRGVLEWFDISKAPKDGREVLAEIPYSDGEGSYIASVYWDNGYPQGPDQPEVPASFLSCRSRYFVKPTRFAYMPDEAV